MADKLFYPQDPLRAGLTHLKDAATPNHPLEHSLTPVGTGGPPPGLAANARSAPSARANARPCAVGAGMATGRPVPASPCLPDAVSGLCVQAHVQKAETKKSLLANTQGAHAAMRLNMEQTILSQYRRLPGFHSEFMGLEIMNESMTSVGVEDILNGAWASAAFPFRPPLPNSTRFSPFPEEPPGICNNRRPGPSLVIACVMSIGANSILSVHSQQGGRSRFVDLTSVDYCCARLMRCPNRSAGEHGGTDCYARGDGATAGCDSGGAFPSCHQPAHTGHAPLVKAFQCGARKTRDEHKMLFAHDVTISSLPNLRA
jgi:hypothetical protein